MMKKILILGILLLVGCQVNRLEVQLLESGHENYTFEYGQELPTTLNHWIDWQNTDQSLEKYDFKLKFNINERVDENKNVLPGSYEGLYTYDKKDYTFNIQIKDTISPKLHLKVDSVKIKWDERIENHPWLDYLVIEELSKTTTSYEILDGKVLFKVCDESGNCSEIYLPFEIEKKVVTKPNQKPQSKPSNHDQPFQGQVDTHITGADRDGYYEESDWIVIP